MRKSFFIFFLLLLLFSIQPVCICMAENGLEAETNIGPFATFSEIDGKKEFRVPPLFGYEKDSTKDSFNLDILWPIANYSRQKEKIQLNVLPFFYFKKDMERQWNRKKYLYILPFYISAEKNDRKTRVFFPLYGHFEGWFGFDSFDFIMFPLYTATREKEEESYSYCWPFFNYSVSGGKRYYRIWPLYGKKMVPEEYEKKFILWPFYNSQKFFNRDGTIDKERLLLFPFYGSFRSDTAETKLLMFPIYMGQKKLKEDYKRYDILWPFLSYARGEERKVTQFFPFFRIEEKGKSFRNFYLWPFMWKGDIRTSGYRKRFFSFVPLYLYNRIQWDKKETDEKLHKLWPLFSYRNDGNTTLVRSLEIIPFNEKGKFGESLYKNIGSIFALWEYYKNTEKNTFSFSVLKGLFGYERKGDLKTYRLFYFSVYKSRLPEKEISPE